MPIVQESIEEKLSRLNLAISELFMNLEPKDPLFQPKGDPLRDKRLQDYIAQGSTEEEKKAIRTLILTLGSYFLNWPWEPSPTEEIPRIQSSEKHETERSELKLKLIGELNEEMVDKLKEIIEKHLKQKVIFNGRRILYLDLSDSRCYEPKILQKLKEVIRRFSKLFSTTIIDPQGLLSKRTISAKGGERID